MILRALAIALGVAATPALAQDGPDGIAFVQLEEGIWYCQGQTPEEAFACATEKCEAEANGQDCVPTTWCLPAKWTGMMTVWLSDFHTTMALCGMPTAEAVSAAFAGICARTPGATACDLSILIDPDGNESETSQSFAAPSGP